MRAMTVEMSIAGDAYCNSVLELMKAGKESLPAPPLTQIHAHSQHFTALSQLNCTTPNLPFTHTHIHTNWDGALAQHDTDWCNMRHQLQKAEEDSYWKGSAAIRGQSLYVHPGAASAAPLWNPEETQTHKVKSKGTVLFIPLHRKYPQ